MMKRHGILPAMTLGLALAAQSPAGAVFYPMPTLPPPRPELTDRDRKALAAAQARRERRAAKRVKGLRVDYLTAREGQ